MSAKSFMDTPYYAHAEIGDQKLKDWRVRHVNLAPGAHFCRKTQSARKSGSNYEGRGTTMLDGIANKFPNRWRNSDCHFG